MMMMMSGFVERVINTLNSPQARYQSSKQVGRGVATGVYRHIYPQNQSTQNDLCGCSSPVIQDRFNIVSLHVRLNC